MIYIIIGDSDKCIIGESVCTIGNARDNGLIMTTGVICSDKIITYNGIDLLQFDAIVDVGCSGGALINSSGQLIGIIKGKYSNDYYESISLAIPINDIVRMIQEYYE